MSKKFILLAVVVILMLGAAFFLKSSPRAEDLVQSVSNGGDWFLPLVTVAAMIDSINPCAFSILLLTIGFLFSMGALRSGILRIGGAYILGIFVAYVLIGLGILQAFHILGIPHFMSKVGAVILLGVGVLDLVNHFFPSFPLKPGLPGGLHGRMAELMKKSSATAAFFLGALVGACEFPCTGGPYLMILGMLHDKSRYLSGLGYLGYYNLIFVLPLVVILFMASDPALLQKVQSWKAANTGRMRLWAGLLMVVLGVVMFVL